MELQPLTSGGRRSENASGKSILRRMPRVWSDEIGSGTDHSDEDPRPSSPGIPILNKAKSDREPARAVETKRCLLSPPPGISESMAGRKESINHEVIGAGLPLLQRLLILKQKNDQDGTAATAAASAAAKPKKVVEHETAENAPRIKSSGAKLKTPRKENSKTASLTKQQRLQSDGRHHQCSGARPRKPTTNTRFWTLLKKATVLTPKAKSQDSKTDAEVGVVQRRDHPAHAPVQPRFEPAADARGRLSSCGDRLTAMCQKLDDQYRQGSLIAQNVSAHNNNSSSSRLTDKCTDGDNFTTVTEKPCRIAQRRPAALRLKGCGAARRRRYDSITDLSPEYAGLSFVKKLKILNERQKLAELEEKSFLRSASLDDSAAGHHHHDHEILQDAPHGRGVDPRPPLTRSHSEAVALEVVLRNQKSRKPGRAAAADECNETAERIRLKNILKQLSSNCFGGDRVHQLMSSQTVEGYAARHSKMTRNVTFDQRRTVVESSPESCGSASFAFPADVGAPRKNPSDAAVPADKTDRPAPESSRTVPGPASKLGPADTQQRLWCASDVRQRCYDEIANGVKTIVERCLVSTIFR